VLVLSGSESGIEQLRRLFESQHGMEIHGYRLIGFAMIPAPRPTPEPAGDRTRGWRRWIGAIDAPAWGVQAILSRHFVPAGVMGMDYSAPLTLDLRRHARRHAWLCATLGGGLVAALAGLIVVMIGDAGGEHPRAIGLALAGFAILAILGVRYAAREWSQAAMLARLADRVEAPFLLSIVERLIGSHQPRRPGRRTGSLGSRKAVQPAQRSEADS
jgi:hypothetical protein